METIATAATVLIWPTLILILISFALWSFSWSSKGEEQRAEATFKLATEKPGGEIQPAEKSPPAQPGAQEHKTMAALEKLSAQIASHSSKLRNHPRLARQGPAIEKATVVFAAASGLLLSYVVGAQWLYSSMVGASYSNLYVAYCQADAVAKVLSNQPGATNFAAAPTINGCEEATGKQIGRRGLAKEEVFHLLESLGLRDNREKTVADLFEAGQPTKNRQLANWLASSDVYYLGMPTTALIVKLAGLLGSGFDIGIKNAAQTGATDSVCRTAGLAVVMSQQPLSFDPAHRTMGQLLLANYKIPTIRKLLETLKPPAEADPKCAGNDALIQNGLGSSFSSRTGWFWAPPIMTRAKERVNDAEVVNIALAWSGWPTPPSKNDPAALAFMRSIASETSGVHSVRDARIATNFFVGEERVAILIVTVFLALCLLWQQGINVVDVRDLRLIRAIQDRMGNDPEKIESAFKVLKERLYRSVGRSAPREILDAALEVRRQQKADKKDIDFDRVRRAAEHETRILERSRFFFLAGLPLLPTIGFIGTVRSLIEALAIADNIPRARDSVDQVNSVLDVTSTLSLCFSTTFMALTALLVFAPLDLWQATAQKRIIEEAERQLDPGG